MEQLKKVRPGDPLRFSAALHNRLIDVARAQGNREHDIGGRPSAFVRDSCVAHARNDSGEAAPWHGVCQITGQLAAGSELLTFGKYDETKEYACGILLEPIPAGGMGLVATHGGPVQVQVSVAITRGDVLEADNDSWEAKGGRGSWRAITDSRGGHCWAVWESGGGASARMVKASANMVADDTLYLVKLLAVDGTEGDELDVYRPNGVRVDEGDTGYLGQDKDGETVFIPCHARHDEGLPFTVEVRGDDPDAPEIGREWLVT